jgi:TonB-linked SusC/RagA family outer membrane protein
MKRSSLKITKALLNPKFLNPMKKTKLLRETWHNSPKKILLIIFLAFIPPLVGILQGHAENFSQTERFSFNSNSELSSIIDKIELESDFSFLYNETLLNLDRKVKINANDQLITDILDKLFTDSGVRYSIIDKKIILSPEKEAKKETPAEQQNAITGKVTDGQTNEAMAGVNISVKGTSSGTITDASGKFSLPVTDRNATLVFSFIGYVTQEVPLAGKNSLNVILLPELVSVDEVVVVGYGRQSKITVTGAISTISSDELTKVSTPTLGEGILGKTAGVQMTQLAGTPGQSDATMFIRGLGTFNATEPLFIIDGVPNSSRDFMQLNPASIKDISVLKDASATAVYGVRGANGVVLVTTRRGQTGKVNVDAQITYGYQRATKLLDFANSYQWSEAYNQMLSNDGKTSGFVSQSHLQHYLNHDQPLLFPDINWVGEVLKNAAPELLSNLNISGGSDKIKYFTSLSYLTQDGLINKYGPAMANFGYNRLNLQTNIDVDITSSTQLSFTTSARIRNRTEPLPVSSVTMATLWSRLYGVPPMTSAGEVDSKFIVPYQKYLPEPIAFVEESFPQYLFRGDVRHVTENRFNFNFDLRQRFKEIIPALDGLVFRAKMGYRSGYDRSKVMYGPKTSLYTALYNRDAATPNPAVADSTVVLQLSSEDGNRSWDMWYDPNRYIYIETGLEYQKSFGKNSISGLVLYNQNKDYYPPSSWAYNNIPTGNIGLVGRVNYDYNQQYIIEFDMGYNGSENFAPKNRFGFFPSVSAGWVVTKEKFMQNIPALSNLKLRLSYGIVGSDQAGGKSRFTYIGSSYNRASLIYYGYNFGDKIAEFVPGTYEDAVGNQEVTWETARKQNYGIDLGFFKNRLNFSFEYFYEYRNDILMNRQSAPGFLGMTLPVLNLGEVKNRGFDATASYEGRAGEISYNINANITSVRNKIMFMDEIEPVEPYQRVTGHPLNSYFGYVWQGFYTEDEVAVMESEKAAGVAPKDRTYAIPTQAAVKAGDMKYEDLNKDGIIDQIDRKVIEYPQYPQITGGLNGSVSWKGIDLSFGAQGAARVSRELNYKEPFQSSNRNSLWKAFYDGYWTPERAAAGTAEWPRLTINNKSFNSLTSTFWIRDASYLRLRRLEIGYTLRNMKLFNIQQARIFVSGNNLITLQKKEFSWSDPEVFNQTYPLLKLYNAGISVTF